LKDLVTRTLTGIFIVIIFLGGICLHPVTFFLVQLVVMSGSLYEYYRIVESNDVKPHTVTGILTGIVMYGVSAAVGSGNSSPTWFLLLILPITGMMITELYRNRKKPFDSLAHTFSGLIYIALPWSLVPIMSFDTDSIGTILGNSIEGFSPGAMIGLIVLLWANDTGAYLVGITLGKHRLFERISPKKSWEGFFGGMAAAVGAAFLIDGWLAITSLEGWIILALLVSIGGTFGDLVESMLKRSAGVKDSGSIMPGHGGFLDRFDSVLIAWPMMFLFITFFG